MWQFNSIIIVFWPFFKEKLREQVKEICDISIKMVSGKYSKNVFTPNQEIYLKLRIKTNFDEEEDMTYSPLPFDYTTVSDHQPQLVGSGQV